MTCSWRKPMYSIASRRTEAVSVCNKHNKLLNRSWYSAKISFTYLGFVWVPGKFSLTSWLKNIFLSPRTKRYRKLEIILFVIYMYLPIRWNKLLKSSDSFTNLFFLFPFLSPKEKVCVHLLEIHVVKSMRQKIKYGSTVPSKSKIRVCLITLIFHGKCFKYHSFPALVVFECLVFHGINFLGTTCFILLSSHVLPLSQTPVLLWHSIFC